MNESNIPTGSHLELDQMYSDEPTCDTCGCATDGLDDDCDDCARILILAHNINA